MFFKKVRQALGLDRCHFPMCSAAPISQDTLQYFMSVNIPLHEIYGMSECSGEWEGGRGREGGREGISRRRTVWVPDWVKKILVSRLNTIGLPIPINYKHFDYKTKNWSLFQEVSFTNKKQA